MSQLTLFNTMARTLEPFEPKDSAMVRLYTCGPTVYDFAHIGNFRTFLFEDILRRTLLFLGYGLRHVMNITDVDDKTIRGALREGLSLEAYTTPFIKAFFEDLDALFIQRAEDYPRATDFIHPMISMIEELIEKEYAYVGTDGSVYYNIRAFKAYGKLSHLKMDELKENMALHDEYDKQNASDFVLWKHYDKERDGSVFWESPFGKGRPGWHMECSCMAIEMLGPNLDIHAGGVDNIFPHHENEIAQSEALTDKPFATLWMHSEHLLVEGKKMSKSAGNFWTLRDLIDKGYSGREVRALLISAHYRTQHNFTIEGLEGVRRSLERLDTFQERLKVGGSLTCKEACADLMERFTAALCDDLNMPKAWAALFDFVRTVNAKLDKELLSEEGLSQIKESLAKIDSVFGVLESEHEVIPQEVVDLALKRQEARAKKEWAEADRCRSALQDLGYTIEESSQGYRLKRV